MRMVGRVLSGAALSRAAEGAAEESSPTGAQPEKSSARMTDTDKMIFFILGRSSSVLMCGRGGALPDGRFFL